MKKQEVVTFKVDESLMDLIREIPNRSEFIRHAILQAMDSVCPLCQGTGILTPGQKRHWDSFLKTHSIERCDECDELFISCVIDSGNAMQSDGHNANSAAGNRHGTKGNKGQ